MKLIIFFVKKLERRVIGMVSSAGGLLCGDIMRRHSSIFALCLLTSRLLADSSSWVGMGSANDFTDPSNWNPQQVPGTADTAVFNAAIADVALNPVSSSADISVSAFKFIQNNPQFEISINNHSLSFSGEGVTGASANPTIQVLNTDNTAFLPASQMVFSNIGSVDGGYAAWIVRNSGTQSGEGSNASLNVLDHCQYQSSGRFSLDSPGSLTVSNVGIDSSTGEGGMHTAMVYESQVEALDGMDLGEKVVLRVSNTGSYQGSNSVTGNQIGCVMGMQLLVEEGLSAGNGVDLTVTNNGISTASGNASCDVALVNAGQARFLGEVSLGDGVDIRVTNRGRNNTNGFGNAVAIVVDQQLYFDDLFTVGDNLKIIVSNEGDSNALGLGGNATACLGSHSGLTGNQVVFNGVCSMGKDAKIFVDNIGSLSDNTSDVGGAVATLNHGQILFNNAVRAEDDFLLSVYNSGNNRGTGHGGHSAATVSSWQAEFASTLVLGANADINVYNRGVFGGTSGSVGGYAGAIYAGQLYVEDALQAGDDFFLEIENIGIHYGDGVGSDFVGSITAGGQVLLDATCLLGDRANISISNDATTESRSASANYVGVLFSSSQFYVTGTFQAGKDLDLMIANVARDRSSGSSGHYTGSIFADLPGQLAFMSSVFLSDNAHITVINDGVSTATNTGGLSAVAALRGSQMAIGGSLVAGKGLSLTVSNHGEYSGSNGGNNSIGTVNGSQLLVQYGMTLGKNTNISVSNSGKNSSSTLSNSIGKIYGNQLDVSGDFTVKKDSTILVSNSAENTGEPDNSVGVVTGSQVVSNGILFFQDNPTMRITNSGIVEGSQLELRQGFIVAEGSRPSLYVVNTGSVGEYGIHILGSSVGGNLDITLENTSLYIDTTGVPSSIFLSRVGDFFDVGGLVGDETSTVQSKMPLIINADKLYDFSGTIADFPGGMTSLEKLGKGEQRLSGVNTYLGDTLVTEGILSVNGSIEGAVFVRDGAYLKGTGSCNGMVTVESGGVLAPGNSIGIMQVDQLVLNPGSYVAFDIDGADSSLLEVMTGVQVGGQLRIVPTPDIYSRRGENLIMTAPSVSGEFSSVSAPRGFQVDVLYGADSVSVEYTFGISQQGLQGNARTIAAYLDAYMPPSLEFYYLAIMSQEEQQQALNSLSPARNSYAMYIAQQTAFSAVGIVNDRMGELRLVKNERSVGDLLVDASDKIATTKSGSYAKVSLWGTALGGFSHEAASSQSPAFSYVSGAGFVGVDCAADTWVCGSALGYAFNHFYEAQKAGDGNIHSYLASIYGNLSLGNWYFSPAFLGAFNKTNNRRNIAFTGYSATARAEIFSWQWVPHLEIGYDIHKALITPFTSVDWAIIWQGGFTERGAPYFNAQQQANDSSMVRSETGLRFSQNCGFCLLREKASYVFEKPYGTGTVQASFVGMPSSFTVVAVQNPLHLGSLGLNALFIMGDREPIKIEFGLTSEFGASFWSCNATLEISKHF